MKSGKKRSCALKRKKALERRDSAKRRGKPRGSLTRQGAPGVKKCGSCKQKTTIKQGKARYLSSLQSVSSMPAACEPCLSCLSLLYFLSLLFVFFLCHVRRISRSVYFTPSSNLCFVLLPFFLPGFLRHCLSSSTCSDGPTAKLFYHLTDGNLRFCK